MKKRTAECDGEADVAEVDLEEDSREVMLDRRPVWEEPSVRPWKVSARLWTLRRAAMVAVGPGSGGRQYG